MSQFYLALTTLATDEAAAQLAQTLVERRLVACVNLIPGVRSFYRWQGKLCDEREVMLTMKTSATQIEPLKQAFAELHPYEVPELIFVPIEAGADSYLKWIEESMRS